MSKELGLLNLLCIVAALAFLALVVISVLSSGDFFTTDNLFIIAVSLLMALLFAINPLLYLKSEGRLPVPGRIAKVNKANGSQISHDEEILSLNADEDSIWEALRALALVGTAEDVPLVQSYAESTEVAQRIKEQARLTAQTIQSRKG